MATSELSCIMFYIEILTSHYSASKLFCTMSDINILTSHYAVFKPSYIMSDTDISTFHYAHFAFISDTDLLTCYHAVPTAFGYLMLRKVGLAACLKKIGFMNHALLLLRCVVITASLVLFFAFFVIRKKQLR